MVLLKVLSMGAMLLISSGAFAGNSLVVGGLTSQPIGHYEFCKKNPSECSGSYQDPGPLHLTAKKWEMVKSVNKAVNRQIRPLNDVDIYGKEEVWIYPTTVGDCEDYVLLKRRELHRRGFPLSNLLITVVRKSDGEGHAVLTITTTGGDLILDNLRSNVLTWDKTGYLFLKRQSPKYPGRWVALPDVDPPPTSVAQTTP